MNSYHCVFSKGMSFLVSLVWLLLLVGAFDDKIHIIGPERVQEFHACVGTSAYIPWPLNVISRTGHRSTVINLIFQRRHSEKKVLIATLTGQRELKADSYIKDRLTISSENSGVFLDRVTMDDAGTYFAQAFISNGEVWTRTTNLTVHLRPIVYNGRLNVSQSEIMYHSGKNIHCVNITCGTLEYAGYPPAKFVWMDETKILSTKVATDDSASSLQICSPYFGDITCSIAGFSSVCTYDHVATLHLDLPGPPVNNTVVLKTPSTQDLILTIVMPILAVLVPLIMLGIWVLSHILKSQQQVEHQEPQAEVENNNPAEQADNNDEDSDGDIIQIEVKDIYDSDDENDLEGNNPDYRRDRSTDFEENEEDDENRVANENDSENYGHRVNEERPLMNEIIGTIV